MGAERDRLWHHQRQGLGLGFDPNPTLTRTRTTAGTISDKGTSPPTLTVTMIRPPSEPCNASLANAYIKPAVRNRARLAAPAARAHAVMYTLMFM